mmetsp:Transcript_3556/g.9682  ORF Transcript_3556/g.9682 Transcript_3556/m.9682 type:complete len:310 (+) Transcript_3556:173-1102(+)|eukprot:CAMPEP_0119121172 /NCGR_PEP_ID=MMETSP1310-20130426/1924_1 /TAXON_ID=464262 /ORGANISM="Genus nov. species nov., Strain RCC2339" /LENGTH=309 /DNA_ID=CAMNT_0007110719 /DNA_START=173 /DNA_END=1102 /DNA_ORIENTATION=+
MDAFVVVTSTRAPVEGASSHPTRILSWNADGLVCRAEKGDLEGFYKAVEEHKCDCVMIQEVRAKPADRGVVRTIQKRLKEFRMWESLHPSKRYSGVVTFLKDTVVDPQRVFYSFHDGSWSGAHHPEGRVIAMEFDSLFVLNTYTPNSGNKHERRVVWDEGITRALAATSLPIVYGGDLNIAPNEIDVSDPARFKGVPGFLPAEQDRFRTLLRDSGLVDAVHRLRKKKAEEQGKDVEAIYTWRGWNPRGRLAGGGMRLDHFLTSPQIPVDSATPVGTSRSSFFGSDHCPVLCVLRPVPAAGSKRKRQDGD